MNNNDVPRKLVLNSPQAIIVLFHRMQPFVIGDAKFFLINFIDFVTFYAIPRPKIDETELFCYYIIIIV